MKKHTKIMSGVVALVLIWFMSSCENSGNMAQLQKENDSLKNELDSRGAKFNTKKKVLFVAGTTPVKWSDYKPWAKKFQEEYYYSNSPVYYSSFLLDKAGLNMFLSSSNIEYLHVMWGMNPTGTNEETMIIRGVGADGTIYYLNGSNAPDTKGDFVLQHCLPCPPCADGVFTLPENEFDFR